VHHYTRSVNAKVSVKPQLLFYGSAVDYRLTFCPLSVLFVEATDCWGTKARLAATSVELPLPVRIIGGAGAVSALEVLGEPVQALNGGVQSRPISACTAKSV